MCTAITPRGTWDEEQSWTLTPRLGQSHTDYDSVGVPLPKVRLRIEIGTALAELICFRGHRVLARVRHCKPNQHLIKMNIRF